MVANMGNMDMEPKREEVSKRARWFGYAVKFYLIIFPFYALIESVVGAPYVLEALVKNNILSSHDICQPPFDYDCHYLSAKYRDGRVLLIAIMYGVISVIYYILVICYARGVFDVWKMRYLILESSVIVVNLILTLVVYSEFILNIPNALMNVIVTHDLKPMDWVKTLACSFRFFFLFYFLNKFRKLY